MIERLRDAGAILIGLTNMPPMANGGMQRRLYGRAESPITLRTSPLRSGPLVERVGHRHRGVVLCLRPWRGDVVVRPRSGVQ